MRKKIRSFGFVLGWNDYIGEKLRMARFLAIIHSVKALLHCLDES